MPTARSNASATALEDILSMLSDDHQRVKKSFREFSGLDPEDDREACQSLIEQTCGELQVHATLEEEVFYPAARRCISSEDTIAEAEVEHMTARMLIEELDGMSPDDERYAATFTVLGEYVLHHIKEEETELFPQLKGNQFDWESLRDDMDTRRQELMEQYLPEMAAAEESSEDELAAREEESPEVGAEAASGENEGDKSRRKPGAASKRAGSSKHSPHHK